MKRYDTYKDSGVEWIGEIPSHWFCVGTNKVYNDLGTGTTPTSDNTEYYSDNGYHWITTTDLNEGIMYDTLSKITKKSVEDYPNLRLYPSGSIYISMYGGRIGKLGVSTFDSYCNQSVCVLPKNDKIIVKFFYYWFLGFQEFVKGMGRGGGQPNINKDMIKSFPTVKIPLTEQQQIVSFLDTKTLLIDSLIEKTQRKIELLKEKRTSLINEVVTKGLNPNVEMKDSGVEWIGEIPSHWSLKKIGYVSKLLTGNPWKSDLFDFESGIKIVRGENVSEGFLRWGSRTRFWKEEVEENSIFYLKEGDIIIGMDGSKVGKNFVRINKVDLPLLLHQRMCRIRVYEGYESTKFIEYWIGSEMFRFYIDISKTDPMIPHITQKNIFDFKIPFPSFSEQQQIVSYLDEQTQLIDNTISIEEKRIELLKEYRQSLISEVVTGKLKVTTDE